MRSEIEIKIQAAAAVATYGKAAQVDMAIEEMSELTKALLKERRAEKETPPDAPGSWEKHVEKIDDISEEIADVVIMLIQLQLIFDNEEQVKSLIDWKLDRLQDRIAKNYGGTYADRLNAALNNPTGAGDE